MKWYFFFLQPYRVSDACHDLWCLLAVICTTVGSQKSCKVSKDTALQIEKCKLSIREAIKECDMSGGDRAILARHFDEDGEIDAKWIFCAKCADQESYEVLSISHS